MFVMFVEDNSQAQMNGTHVPNRVSGNLLGSKANLMGWASQYIEKLKSGETVSFRPRGNSMVGKIDSGQLCRLEPVAIDRLSVGDIVLCKVNGQEYLHLIKAIDGGRFQIGNNRGGINGWTPAKNIFGKCVSVE